MSYIEKPIAQAYESILSQIHEKRVRRKRDYFYNRDSSYSLDAIVGSIENRILNGTWDYGEGDWLLDIVKSHGVLAGQRYVENEPHEMQHWDNGEFRVMPGTETTEEDKAEYRAYAYLAYRCFGQTVGGYFSRSYEDIHRAGVTGKDYFSLTKVAVENGGRLFAAQYVSSLPSVLQTGESAGEFGHLAESIYKHSNIKTARSFMINAEDIRQVDGMSLVRYGNVSHHALKEIGKQAGYWFIREAVQVNRELGYIPEEFLKDGVSFKNQIDEKAAGWYAYGVGGLSAFSQELTRQSKNQFHYLYPPYEKSARNTIQKLDAQKRQIDIHQYKDSYSRLLTLGQTAATTYALLTRTMAEKSIHGDEYHIEDWKLLPSALHNLKMQVRPGTFSAFCWFAPKMETSFTRLMQLMENIANVDRHNPSKKVKDAIAYTAGVCKSRGPYKPSAEATVLMLPGEYATENGVFSRAPDPEIKRLMDWGLDGEELEAYVEAMGLDTLDRDPSDEEW